VGIPVLIIYSYSGTGNSRLLAEILARDARRSGATAVHRSLETADPSADMAPIPPDAVPGDMPLEDTPMVMIVTPTHAFNAPWRVWRFVMALPRGSLAGKRRRATCLFTRASIPWGTGQIPGIAGTGPLTLTVLLWIRGYRPMPPVSIDMPSNWTAVHTGIRRDRALPIIRRGIGRARCFFREIRDGTRSWITVNAVWDLVFGVLLIPVTAGYLAMGRLFLAKIFFADTRCNRCGQCATECPNGAIRLPDNSDQPPFWTWRCESCMRCMNRCPRNAVQVSTPWLTGLMIFWMWAVGSGGVFALLRWIPRSFPLRSAVFLPPLSWVIAAGVSWLLLPAAYRLFYRCARIPRFRRFLEKTAHSRWFRQYHAPEF